MCHVVRNMLIRETGRGLGLALSPHTLRAVSPSAEASFSLPSLWLARLVARGGVHVKHPRQRSGLRTKSTGRGNASCEGSQHARESAGRKAMAVCAHLLFLRFIRWGDARNRPSAGDCTCRKPHTSRSPRRFATALADDDVGENRARDLPARGRTHRSSPRRP